MEFRAKRFFVSIFHRWNSSRHRDTHTSANGRSHFVHNFWKFDIVWCKSIMEFNRTNKRITVGCKKPVVKHKWTNRNVSNLPTLKLRRHWEPGEKCHWPENPVNEKPRKKAVELRDVETFVLRLRETHEFDRHHRQRCAPSPFSHCRKFSCHFGVYTHVG